MARAPEAAKKCEKPANVLRPNLNKRLIAVTMAERLRRYTRISIQSHVVSSDAEVRVLLVT
jgi:hypothetical protein